jgi:hypothetical protein
MEASAWKEGITEHSLWEKLGEGEGKNPHICDLPVRDCTRWSCARLGGISPAWLRGLVEVIGVETIAVRAVSIPTRVAVDWSGEGLSSLPTSRRFMRDF